VILIRRAEGKRNSDFENLLLLVLSAVVADTCRTERIRVQPLNKTFTAFLILDINPYTFSTVPVMQHNLKA